MRARHWAMGRMIIRPWCWRWRPWRSIRWRAATEQGARWCARFATRPKIPALTFDIGDVKKTFDKRIAARERGRERGLTRRSALPAIHRIASKNLPRALRLVQQDMPQQDVRAMNLITAHATSLIVYPDGLVKPDPFDDETLSADVQHIMECMQAAVANHQGNGPDAKQERRWMLIDRLGAICRNEFRSTPARLAANTANV